MGRPILPLSLLTTNIPTSQLADASNINDAISKKHTQNTDVGTTATTFYLDNSGTKVGIKKVDADTLTLVKNDGSTIASLTVQNLQVKGTSTIVHSTEVDIDDNIVVLNAGTTSTGANVDGGLVLNRAAQAGTAITSIVASTRRVNSVAHGLTADKLVYIHGTEKNDGLYEVEDATTDPDYFIIKATAVLWGASNGVLTDETTPVAAKATKASPVGFKMGTDGKVYITDAISAGGWGSFREIATVDGTQAFTNKTLTSPKLNEDVVLSATATKLNALVGGTDLATADYHGHVNATTSVDGFMSSTDKTKLDGLTSTPTWGRYTLTASGGETYVDLSDVAITNSERVTIDSYNYDKTANYTVNYTGGAGGKTRITWVGFTLTAGEVVIVTYQY